MTGPKRKNTVELASEYIFKGGAYVAAGVLILTAASWFSIQLISDTSALVTLYAGPDSVGGAIHIQLGVVLGLVSAKIAMYGIRGLKWLCVITVIPLIAFIIYTAFFADFTSIVINSPKTISLYGLPAVIVFWLAATADYLTFFRHSDSMRQSVVALLAILVFSIVVQVSGAFLGGSVLPGRESLEVIDAYPSGWLSLTAYTGFLILSNLAINIANIYWASVAWELLVPKYVGKKEYLILGLIGVIWFVLIRSEHVHIFLATIGDIIIGCLACVFVMVFIADKLGHHRLMLSDKIIASIGWTIGSLAGLVYLIVFEGSQINSLFLGAAITSTLIGTLTTGRWLLGKSHSLVR